MELQLIQSKIYEIRGARVMLDFDLATLYEVETKRLKEAVRRNIARFPTDFMFELTKFEWRELVANCVQFSQTIKHASAPPFAFTEHGVTMLSGILRSERAIAVNIEVVRAFVAMRQLLVTTSTISAELADIRAKMQLLEQGEQETLCAVNDLSEDMRNEIADIYLAIGELSARPTSGLDPNRKMIGFNTGKD